MKANLGYTLIEMIFVLGIAAILLSISAPSFSSMMQRQRTEVTRDAVMATMLSARRSAVEQGNAVVVCAQSGVGANCGSSLNWQGRMIAFADLDNNREPAESEILQIYELPADLETTATRRKLVFQGDGSARGNNLTVTICGKAEKGASAVVANSGRVRGDKKSC